MKRIHVAKLTPKPGSNQQDAFLAIDAEERPLWEERLAGSDWPDVRFLDVAQQVIDSVTTWPDDALILCAAAFAHGTCMVANPQYDSSASGFPLLYWNTDNQRVDCMSYSYKELQKRRADFITENHGLLVLIAELERFGLMFVNHPNT